MCMDVVYMCAYMCVDVCIWTYAWAVDGAGAGEPYLLSLSRNGCSRSHTCREFVASVTPSPLRLFPP